MAKKKDTRVVRTGLRQTWGALLLIMGLVSLLSLLTYDWHDIEYLNASAGDHARNCFGLAGAYLSHGLLLLFGFPAYCVPILCLILGCVLLFRPDANILFRVIWALLVILSLSALVEIQHEFWSLYSERFNLGTAPGGHIMHLLVTRGLVRVLNESGTAIIAALILILAIVKLIGTRTFVAAYQQVGTAAGWVKGALDGHIASRGDAREQLNREEQKLERERLKLEKTMAKEQRQAEQREKVEERQRLKAEKEREREEAKKARIKAAEDRKKRMESVKPAPEQKAESEPEPILPVSEPRADGTKYDLPSIDLLDEVPASSKPAIDNSSEVTGRVLVDTLAEFGIEVQVEEVQQGPVVTRYELLPASGVRVEKIASLSNNLALALKAHSVRVQAPVPGKGVVGVEVPNSTSSIVYVREVLESETWKTSKAALPLVLGKDVGGNDVVGDLAAMPHLLVAGATGSGKTVCMNSILLGLLMSRTPDQLQLMLVDPKIVEFTMFSALPHLVVPVINDPHKVALGLRWAIKEMEKRYKMFSKVGVRNIEGFNSRPKQTDMFDAESESDGEETKKIPETIPYIVIVVDELADLMLVAQADIENCIARLAQLSRAVGIHMILATQRPSVNVITGTIKANFPARIAFQVAQRVDSRTILDANGADKLLGKGDMLFLPPGSNRILRAQGSMVTDPEMKRVVDFIKAQAEPSYNVEIHQKIKTSKVGQVGSVDSGEDDALLEQAITIIRETRRASTSSLQRRLRIGYTRAARMMDILEERGVIGPPRGSDPREILIDLDGEIPTNPDGPEDADVL